MAEEELRRAKHSLIMTARRELSVSGIEEVSGFNDESVTLVTAIGELTVSGGHLHISKFSQETGELLLDGEIDCLRYSESRKEKGSFFSRLFR